MKTYVVNGPAPLSGEVAISGAKNSALKIMAASLMIPGQVCLRRVPNITDVWLMADVLERLGAKVIFEDDRLTIDASGELAEETPYELVTKMRASIQVLGPLLARRGAARVAMPGGDAIGSRPVDLHLQGLEKMGAKFTVEHGYIEARTSGLKGTRILLEFPSVGATENLLMSAVMAEGTTVIDNAAREPEIQDLASFLNAAGARIAGAGTPTITVEGVEDLASISHEIIPDRIEAGTFAIGAAATRGDVRLTNLRSDHLDLVLQKLTDAGAEVQRKPDEVRVSMSRRPEALNLVTLPYPGFPTDLQPSIMVLLAQAGGSSILTENVFEARFLFVDELNRMGSQIRVEGHHAVIRGVERLSGAPVQAPDIRAGAALVLGGLCAEGRTEVHDRGHIKRGYEDFVSKLTGLGADIHLQDLED
ncbi:MAG: UDP-N-acetylglucosamine 1-carboxyvinyltransferase [Actinomycetota bacterium]|jgi:UDP-N-acetylglucosamine 1-carboxyvinyltransferase|nr:UDP-N-acetylglucosamine 1-carboxyvinyltransferase [Actinomycetota bacterium]